MTEPWSRSGLTVLRIGYRDRPGPPRVRCELSRSGRGPRWRWDTPARQIGLPVDGGRATPNFGRPRGFRPIVDWIRASRAGGDQALWLDLSEEHPLLPAIDWEYGLRRLGIPVLRLPAHTTAPAWAPRNPRVALWVTMPRAKTSFPAQDMVRTAVLAMGMPTEVHVFTDAGLVGGMRDRFGDHLTVHEPVDRPWLDWITGALGRRSADVLHLIGHGYLGPDQGAFATAESPVSNFDTASARFIWPRQLETAMTAIGAGALIGTAVRANYSVAGLRLLCHRIATIRSAATVLHRAVSPADDLLTAYQLLLGPPAPFPVRTTRLSTRVHPERFGPMLGPAGGFPWPDSEPTGLVGSGAGVDGGLAGAQRQIRELEAQLAAGPPDARAGLAIVKSRLDALLRATGGPG